MTERDSSGRFIKGHHGLQQTVAGKKRASDKIKQAWKDGRMTISSGHTGKKHSEETKKRLSEHFKKHPVSYWSGKKRPSPTEETRRKVSEKLRGPLSRNWRGGVYQPNNRVRRSLEYRLWRKSVFERDKFICVLCKTPRKKIQADHIKSFAEYPELRFDINNGRTLCVDCHRNTDTYGWKTAKRLLAVKPIK